MATELIVNASLPETRIALMEEGEIQELLIERATGKGIVGNIYKGRVTRVLPGMQAAFVDIGLEKAAFLYVDDVYVHSDIWAEEEGQDDEEELEKPARSIKRISARTDADRSDEGRSENGESESTGDANESELSLNEGDASSNEGFSEENDSESSLEAASFDDEVESDSDDREMMADDRDSDDRENEAEEDSSDEEEDEDSERPMAMASDDRGPVETISERNGQDDRLGDDLEDEENLGNREASDSEAPASEVVEPSLAPIYLGETDDGVPIFASATEEGVQPAAAPNRFVIGAKRIDAQPANAEDRKKFRRGRRGGKGRFRRGKDQNGAIEGEEEQSQGQEMAAVDDGNYPEPFYAQVSEDGETQSDRSAFSGEVGPEGRQTGEKAEGRRPEFKEPRNRDRKIRSKTSTRPQRVQVNIQDLLKEGQEVIVQIAKDPIATKGARLTCHISLPGRHLVCMPTIDHVGVSRRIERDDERRKLREYVESNRPKKLGFIVRTATAAGKVQSERRIKQDIDYLSKLWEDIRENAGNVTAPALVYEDLNPVLRAIRDWVNEDIDKITVDSRYHFNEVTRFVSHFMPSVKQKVELYAGDIPIFDAYNISTELSRALERKVWLKSGGYIVVDQAEALVAIDVNTGRYVGKKSLEDTILKTNLEAVREIAYQLRLRNCGGIIIIDLIDMEKEENKYRVYRALEEELKKDRARPQILKISELGLIEMTRKRTRDTMVRALCDSCTHCEGKGYIKSKQTVAYEVLRDIEREGIDREVTKILIQAHPDVIDNLAIDERDSLDQLERRYRKQVYLQAVTDFHLEQFEVIGEKRNSGERSEDEILERAREGRSGEGGDRNRGRNNRRDRGRRGSKGGSGGADRNDREAGGSDRNGGDRNSGDRNSSGRNDRGDRPEGGRGGRGGSDRNDRNQDRGEREDRSEAAPRENRIKIGGNPITIQSASTSSGVTPVAVDEFEDRQPQFDAEGNIISNQRNRNQSGGGNLNAAGMLDDEFSTEEDRIAFQRAQAAQDAAIANLAQGAGSPSTFANRGNGGANGGRGNFPNKNRQGGRWGKNRGGDRNAAGGGGNGGGAGNGGPNGGGGGKRHGRPSRFQGGFKRSEKGPSAPMNASSSEGGGGSGGEGTPPSSQE
jgi:Rne/Rng family ribonuclease